MDRYQDEVLDACRTRRIDEVGVALEVDLSRSVCARTEAR